MTQKIPDDDLSLFLEAGKQQELPDTLRTRILTDAEKCLPKPTASGWRIALRDWARGWAMPSVAGGVGATLAGLYLGLVMPLSMYDAPVWMDSALGVFETVTAPIVGVQDPLELGF